MAMKNREEQVEAEIAGILSVRGRPKSSANGRPSWCFGKNGDDIIILIDDVNGYQETPYHMSGELDIINEMIGVNEKQAKAMLIGSLFGWHVPGADPSYDG